jgi:uncharacterized protein (DUF302 family)
MTYLRYGFVKTLENATFEDAIGQVTQALNAQGFGILTEIDVKKTLKQKLDHEFRRYTILGACNPTLAKEALDAESQIGLLLPCNVVVQEAPEMGVIVSIADPSEMFTLAENPNLAAIAKEARRRLRHVMASLG